MRSRTALIADDCALTRALHADILRSLGFRVTAVGSGAAAAREATRSLRTDGLIYDLTVLDYDMPDGDGPGAARAIRALGPIMAGMSLLCVTGHDPQRVEALCRDAGFDAVMSKPLQADLLADWLRERAPA